MTQKQTYRTGRIVAFFPLPADGSEPDWDAPARYMWADDGLEATADDWERVSRGSITAPYETYDANMRVAGWHCSACVK
jgi:hypothetical protein